MTAMNTTDVEDLRRHHLGMLASVTNSDGSIATGRLTGVRFEVAGVYVKLQLLHQPVTFLLGHHSRITIFDHTADSPVGV